MRSATFRLGIEALHLVASCIFDCVANWRVAGRDLTSLSVDFGF